MKIKKVLLQSCNFTNAKAQVSVPRKRNGLSRQRCLIIILKAGEHQCLKSTVCSIRQVWLRRAASHSRVTLSSLHQAYSSRGWAYRKADLPRQWSCQLSNKCLSARQVELHLYPWFLIPSQTCRLVKRLNRNCLKNLMRPHSWWYRKLLRRHRTSK